jgi:hypothetical protein
MRERDTPIMLAASAMLTDKGLILVFWGFICGMLHHLAALHRAGQDWNIGDSDIRKNGTNLRIA